MAASLQALLELVHDAGVHRVERQCLDSRVGSRLADGGCRTHRVAEDAQVGGVLDALDPVDHRSHVLLLKNAEGRLAAGAAAAIPLVEGDEVEPLV